MTTRSRIRNRLTSHAPRTITRATRRTTRLHLENLEDRVVPVTGFGGNGLGWTLNGVATVSNDVATLTDNGNSEAGSVFYNTLVPTAGDFTASYTYTPSGSLKADGAAFVLQSIGPTALGGTGGYLGYYGITSSLAVALNIYSGHPIGTALYTNGNVSFGYQPVSPVVLNSGDPINVELDYSASTQTLTEVLTDASNNNTDTVTFTGVDVSSLVGNSAYVGFTGATGGDTSTQRISNFSFGGPALTAISPDSAVTGGASFTLTANGVAFQDDSIVQWNGVALTTTPVSSSQLTAVVPAGDLAQPYGSANITVMNPTVDPGTSRPRVIYLNTPTATPPSLTAPTSASITADSATLGGTVAADNGSLIQKRGFLYAPTATNANPTLGGAGVIEVDDPAATVGSFTASVTGLNPNTTYSFVAFATNDIGTGYTSPVSSFSTQAAMGPSWTFSSAFDNTISGYTLGSKFSTSVPFTISALGMYAPNGLSASHSVGIWTSGGTLLAQTTVDPADTPLNQFLYHSLTTPLSLPAGTYVVGAFYNTTEYYGSSATGFSTLPGVTFLGADSKFNRSALTFPTSFQPGFKGYFGAAFLVAANLPNSAAYVLNATRSGAVTASGNARISLSGGLVVDSASSSAILASGNAQVNVGGSVLVVGGVSESGTASVTKTGAPATADPLAWLPPPLLSGTNYGAVSVAGNTTMPLSPGVYTSIKISGNAVVTLSPGTYIILGGGFTVSGNASVTGYGVTIFNAGSSYANDGVHPATDGGSFGGITLSGNGNFSLSPPTSGIYAGIVIDQSRVNTRALAIGGNALVNVQGAIYAANALLTLSGHGNLQDTLVVNMLNVSGDVALTQMAAGSDGAGDAVGIANSLLAGDLSVYVNDPGGLFTADQLARIQDAINTWDTLLAPYNVTITQVSDPSLANLVIDIGLTSACGGSANGVLGCFNAPNREITMIQDWNWYAGSDATQIGANQYDFETTVLHELGHALGLGGGTDPSSPMYETLAPGVADRTVTAQDLNIPDSPDGADPQMAAGLVPGSATLPASPIARAAVPVAVAVVIPGPSGLPPLPSTSSQWPVVSGQGPAAGTPTGSQAGPGPTLVVQGVDDEGARALSSTGPDADRVLDAALTHLVTGADPSRGERTDGTTQLKVLPAEGDVEDGTGMEPIRSDRIDPTEFARPVELPLRIRPVERGVIRPGSRTDAAPDELAAAVGWRWPMGVPGDPIARPANPREPGEALAKLGTALIVAGSWGHRARFRGATSRRAGRPRERERSE